SPSLVSKPAAPCASQRFTPGGRLNLRTLPCWGSSTIVTVHPPSVFMVLNTASPFAGSAYQMTLAGFGAPPAPPPPPPPPASGAPAPAAASAPPPSPAVPPVPPLIPPLPPVLPPRPPSALPPVPPLPPRPPVVSPPSPAVPSGAASGAPEPLLDAELPEHPVTVTR